MEFISFVAKTWFFWWSFAVVCILVWFHRIESDAYDRFEMTELEERKPEIVPLEVRAKRAHLLL